MNIKSVTLTNGGFKGLKAEYTQPSERGGKSMVKPELEKKDYPYPIHLALEVPFKDLRYHLLSLCDIIADDMDKNDKDSLINECEVTGIVIDGDSFIIKGTKENRAGKSFKLTTPKEEEGDGYPYYQACIDIIGKIVTETKLYLRGDVKVTDDELLTRYIGSMKESDKNKDGYEEMDDDQKKAYHRDILERVFGAVVLMEEDITIGDHADEESFVIDPKEEVITLPAKK